MNASNLNALSKHLRLPALGHAPARQWNEWGEEALCRGEAREQAILLDIGACGATGVT